MGVVSRFRATAHVHNGQILDGFSSVGRGNVFFVAVFFAGLTSLINLYEAPIATVQEKFHLGRVAACGVIGVIGVVVSLLIQGIVSQWMDVLSIYICPLGAGLAGVMFFWICGKKYVQSQVDKGRSSKFTDLYYVISFIF